MIILIFLVTSNWSSCSLDSHSIATPWTIAHQAPLSMGSPRQEYWSGPPFHPPGDLPNSEIEPGSPALADRFSTLSHLGSHHCVTGHNRVNAYIA